ncbi:hypothetical protein ACFFGT_02795 [Mucilaginibacter angelicae]|uniref:Uncharacterized protein n=1 Tax=Mucilaginibacter angelicae TaxID=869718 RepID=A0ABV6L048_9SPHI
MDLINAHKSFWKENDYPYIKVVEIPEAELIQLITKLSRTDVIEWLIWNDRNGVYSDESSIREFGKAMSIEEGIEIMLRQAEENRVVTHWKVV